VTNILFHAITLQNSFSDAWILTDGIDTGMSKFIGEGISYHHLLHECSNKIKCIGLNMWGAICEDERHNLKKATKVDGEQDAEY
jgi:hypothetical protein